MFINGFSFENYYYRQHLVIFIIIILHNTQCSEQIQCCPIHTFIFKEENVYLIIELRYDSKMNEEETLNYSHKTHHRMLKY